MAVGDAYVFPGFLTPVLTLLSFQSHRLLFSHASAEVRGENTPERKVASTWDRTHNHQVMSLTRSPLSHPGGSIEEGVRLVSNFVQRMPRCFQCIRGHLEHVYLESTCHDLRKAIKVTDTLVDNQIIIY